MSHSLRPRSVVPAETLAAITAAAQALLTPVGSSEPATDSAPAWRFSGRWFASSPLSSQRRPRG